MHKHTSHTQKRCNTLRKTLCILLICLTFFMNCQESKNVELVQQTDLKGIFEIGIPDSWHIEKQESENSSFIIASDTTISVEQALVVDLTWNDWEIYLNEHLKRSLDSINEIAGFATQDQKFYSLGEFDIYEYQTIGIDSLNNLDIKAKNYFLKKNGKQGSLNLNVQVNNRDFTRNDSIIIDRIIESIKRK